MLEPKFGILDLLMHSPDCNGNQIASVASARSLREKPEASPHLNSGESLARRDRFQRFVLLSCAATLLLQGCTLVQVRNAAGITVDWGVCSVVSAPDVSLMLVDTTTLGLSVSTNGMLLGFTSETRLELQDPERCQAIFIVRTAGERDDLLRFFSDSGTEPGKICIATGG